MSQKYVNNAFSTLVSTVLPAATSIFVQPGHGNRWPVIAAPDFCYTTLEDAVGNIEIVKVTARTLGSDELIVQRAQQGTTARTWSMGDLVELRVTAVELTAFEADIDDLEATRAKIAGDTYTGTHDFDAATAVLVPNVAQADNSTKAANTAYVDAGLAGKADITGETYTGAHDFTGATLRAQTKAFGTSGNEVATVDYVNQATFQAVLPAQTGNDGKVLTTNGTTASWEWGKDHIPLLALGII